MFGVLVNMHACITLASYRSYWNNNMYSVSALFISLFYLVHWNTIKRSYVWSQSHAMWCHNLNERSLSITYETFCCNFQITFQRMHANIWSYTCIYCKIWKKKFAMWDHEAWIALLGAQYLNLQIFRHILHLLLN